MARPIAIWSKASAPFPMQEQLRGDDRRGGLRARQLPQPLGRHRRHPLGLAHLMAILRSRLPPCACRLDAWRATTPCCRPRIGCRLPWPARCGLRACAKLGRPRRSHGNGRLTAALGRIGPELHQARPVPGDTGRTWSAPSARRGIAQRCRIACRHSPWTRRARRSGQSRSRRVEELFAEFGPPVAAASIAQVHRATTRDGRDVAVKILRPGIEQRFARDLSEFLLRRAPDRAR